MAALWLGCLPVLGPGLARGDLFLELAGSDSPQPPGPNPDHDPGTRQDPYTYDVYLTPRTAPWGNGGQVTDSADTENDFRIFDFCGYAPGSAVASNLIGLWSRDRSIVEATSTPTHAPATPLPGDTPRVPNVGFKYQASNASLAAPGTGMYFGQFSLRSPHALAFEGVSSYSAATQRASNFNLIASDTSLDLGPAVPERPPWSGPSGGSPRTDSLERTDELLTYGNTGWKKTSVGPIGLAPFRQSEHSLVKNRSERPTN